MSRYRRSLAAGATFFFTVNLANRSSRLLFEEIDRLRRAFDITRSRRPFLTLAYCVLPDHMHTVWEMPENDADFGLRWRVIKRLFTSGLAPASTRSTSKIVKREKGIWQRRFWEHQIRDDADLQHHVDYVHFNPVKHGHAKVACEWPYSSFQTYVQRGWLPQDWGGCPEANATGLGERV